MSYTRLQPTLGDRILDFLGGIFSFGVGDGPTQNSIKLFNLPAIGIPLYIHKLWILFIILSCLLSLHHALSIENFLVAFIVFGPVLFLTVLVHEIGHCLMAKYLGGNADMILLWPLGGIAYISFFGESEPWKDALVAIAGPLTHFPQFFIWISFFYFINGNIMGDIGAHHSNWTRDISYICYCGTIMQIALFSWNLIPAYPLDGGRLLAAFLGAMKTPTRTAYRVSAIVGAVSIVLKILFVFYTSQGPTIFFVVVGIRWNLTLLRIAVSL